MEMQACSNGTLMSKRSESLTASYRLRASCAHFSTGPASAPPLASAHATIRQSAPNTTRALSVYT